MMPSPISGPVTARAARIPALVLFVAALVCSAFSCARSLDNQACPCATGWTCCASQNRCLPAGATDSCPGDQPVPVVMPQVCTADGWCGATPPFTGIWGSADNDLWIVAADVAAPGVGQPIHFDGTKWETPSWTNPDGANPGVAAIWGSGPNDVFALGGGGIVHFDGATWKPQGSTLLGAWSAVSGTGPDNVWAVGAVLDLPPTGTISHYDGNTWSQVSAPAVPDITVNISSVEVFTGVWAAGPRDAWAIGVGGIVLRWNGAVWSSQSIVIDGAPVTSDLHGVWGSSARDVWVVGAEQTILHFDGNVWSRPVLDVAVAGEPRAVSGGGPNDVWIAGDSGLLIHWDGATWSVAPTNTLQGLHAIWKSPRGGVWAVGDAATAVHGRGDVWAATAPSPLAGLQLTAIRGSRQNDIWVAGPGTVRHFDGQSWLTCPAQADWSFERIWVIEPWHAFVVGSGAGLKEYRITAGACVLVGAGTSTDLHDIWGNAPDDIWAVGAHGTVQHWDGAVWSDVPVPTTADILAVWGSPTNVEGEPIYVWALTGGDTAIRWDRTSWSVISPLTGRIGASWKRVTGTAVYDTWIFGTDASPDVSIIRPVERHLSGTTWTKAVLDEELFGLVVDGWCGPGGLWVAGWTVHRLGGIGWVSSYTGVSGGLVGIWGDDWESDMWAVGPDGAFVHNAHAF